MGESGNHRGAAWRWDRVPRVAVLVVLAAACGAPPDRTPAATTKAGSAGSAGSGATKPPVGATPPVQVAPHGSVIEQLAIADSGDAAISFDQDGALRLWPSFDGKHEPVVVHAAPAIEVAITRIRDGLLVALLDRAGGLVLLRHAADGKLRDQVALPPEPGFEQVRLVGGSVLALGRDQRVTRFDERGRVTGSIGAPAEQEIESLAVRGDHAVAAIVPRGHKHIDTIRSITLQPALAWGKPIRLPEPLSSLSIAPNGQRLAGVSARDGSILLLDLASKPKVRSLGLIAVGRADPFESPRAPDAGRTGFLDDDRVVATPADIVVTWAEALANPRKSGGTALQIAANGQVANGVVVSVEGGSLVITRDGRAQYLGYRHRGAASQITPAGKDVMFATGKHLMQLDARLRRVRTVELPDLFQNYVVPIDERHIVYAVEHEGGYRFELYDLETRTRAKRGLGKFNNNAFPYYDPSSRVLAIKDETVTYRYAIDPATMTITPLRSLKTPTFGSFAVVDPKLAGGVIAVAIEVSRERESSTLLAYYDDGGKAEPIVARKRLEVSGDVLGTDRAGITFMVEKDQTVKRYQHAQAISGFPITTRPMIPTLELGGEKMIFAVGPRHLVALDIKGAERWRSEIWHIEQVELTSDGKTLIVETWGGTLALDAATGERVARACAWDFGLHPLPVAPPGGAPSVCAE